MKLKKFGQLWFESALQTSAKIVDNNDMLFSKEIGII